MEGLRGLKLVARRRSSAAQSAGDVDLPTRRRAESVFLIISFEAGKAIGDRAKLTCGTQTLRGDRSVQVDGREKLSAGALRGSTRLLNASERTGQVEVLIQRALDDGD